MKNLLLSAVIGDISSQPYEFTRRTKDNNFANLLNLKNTYIDDTICIFACAEALLYNMAENFWNRCRADSYQGFGERLTRWLIAKKS